MAHYHHFDEPPVYAEDEPEDDAGAGSSTSAKAPSDAKELDRKFDVFERDDDGDMDPDLQRGAIVMAVNKIKGRLGMDVRTTKKKGTRILKVHKGGLAEASSLQPKDTIIKINDTSILGWDHYKVNSFLKHNEIDTLTIIRRANPNLV